MLVHLLKQVVSCARYSYKPTYAAYRPTIRSYILGPQMGRYQAATEDRPVVFKLGVGTEPMKGGCR